MLKAFCSQINIAMTVKNAKKGAHSSSHTNYIQPTFANCLIVSIPGLVLLNCKDYFTVVGNKIKNSLRLVSFRRVEAI